MTQYSPITKKFIGGDDPQRFLAEHILRGDSSDGIPNVLSPDNTFVDGLRQRPLSKRKVATWIDNELEDSLPNDEALRNYQRNEKLIDLSKSPNNLFTDIIKEYQNTPEGDRSKLLNYFIEKRLNEHLENIGDF